MHPRGQNLHYSVIDKHQLLKQKNNKRIIFVGGSNLSFGLISEIIADSLGACVINTAISAGYGLKYIVDDIKPYIKANDLIVLIPEYEHFYGNRLYGGLALLRSLNTCPTNISLLSLNQINPLLTNLFPHIRTRLKSLYYSYNKKKAFSKVYHRTSFNGHGDATGHWDLKQRNKAIKEIKGSLNTDAFSVLKAFEKYVISKNASLIFLYPAFKEMAYNKNKPKIDSLFVLIQKEQLNFQGKPTNYLLTEDFFFDTQYHLTMKGAHINTLRILKDIKQSGALKPPAKGWNY